MKLIIDVPDEEYKTLSKMSEKEKVNELSYYEMVIANSIPYEPKGDLISREALKKEVVGMMINKADDLEEVEFEINSALASVCEKIDNAPTVDIPKPNCVTCDHFGECEGCEKREEE